MDKYIEIKQTDDINQKMIDIFEKDKNTTRILKNSNEYTREEINKAMIDHDIITSLRGVIDPELGVNIFDLGLIYDFKVVDNTVYIEYTLTTIGCPLGNYIEMTILENVNRNMEYDGVFLNITFTPQWNINALPYETKLLLDML